MQSTYWVNVFGEEVSATVEDGASSQFKNALAIELGSSDVNRGYEGDYAVALFGRGQAASSSWQNGIAFGRTDKPWSFASDSSLITAVPQSRNASNVSPVAGIGLDFSKVSFTTASAKLPGASFDPTGQAAIANLSITRTPNGAGLDANKFMSAAAISIAGSGQGCSLGGFLYFGSTGILLITGVNASYGVTSVKSIVPDVQLTAPAGAQPTTGTYCNSFPTVSATYSPKYELDLNPSRLGNVVVGAGLRVNGVATVVSLTNSGTTTDASKARVSATGTDSVPATTSWLAFVQAGTLASEALTLPASPADGQMLRISTIGQITALSLAPNVPGWTNRSMLPANSGFTIGWDAPSATWLKVQ